MCQTKPQFVVRVSTLVGGPVVILFGESGQAQSFDRIINEQSDASSMILGEAHELKLIAPGGTGEEDPAQVTKTLELNFRRVSPKNACLVELRRVSFHQDDDGGFWTATAIWVHGTVARITSTESAVVDTRSQQDADIRARHGA